MAFETVVDLTDQFCGCGGGSQGATQVPDVEIRTAINHSPIAIECHNANFPGTDHDCMDMSGADPLRYKRTTGLLTSPVCTTYSPAGARKRFDGHQQHLFFENLPDKEMQRSRATMWDPIRFARVHRYEFIIVENVPQVVDMFEFWDLWLREWDRLGYVAQICNFNSRFFPWVPQSRDRLYVVLSKKGNPLPDLDYRPTGFCRTCEVNVEARQVWKNPNRVSGCYGQRRQYLYRCPTCRNVVEPYYSCAANVIDWSHPMTRIGDMGDPLAPKTLCH